MPVNSPTHLPSPARLSGVLAGFHSLKEPATKTDLASGLSSSNRAFGPLTGFGASALAGPGFMDAGFGGSVFTDVGVLSSICSGSTWMGDAFVSVALVVFPLSFGVLL